MFAKEWDATKCVYNSASTKSKGDLDRMRNKDGMKKQENLQILLAELGFFTKIKTKQIKFNPRPRSNPEHIEWVKTEKQKEAKPIEPVSVDLHLEITAKVDEVIRKHEQENRQTELNNFDKPVFIEIRKPWHRTPMAPQFKTDITLDDFSEDMQVVDDLFEVITPETNIEAEPQISDDDFKTEMTKELQLDEFENMTVVKKIDSFDEMLSGLGRIKVRKDPNKTKSTPHKTQQKKNGVTVAKTDLDKTKAALERKKHELEEIERLAKQKEEEFKKKQGEKKKQLKLKKQKEKEMEKQRKIKEKLEKKHQIELEKEQRKKEKQLLLEKKKQEKLQVIEEKRLQREQELQKKHEEKIKAMKEKEKIKKLDLKKKQAEQEEKEKLLKQEEKQKEIEAKKKLEEKQEQLKQIEKQKEIKEKPKKPEKPEKKPSSGLFGKKKKEKTKETEKIETETKIEKEPETIKEEPRQPTLDEEVSEALRIIDDLLEKLPEDTIDEFVQSDDFAVYEKVVSKYKRK